MSVFPAESLVLDGYRLVRFLGRGGFGEVWLCQSQAMGGHHALKFIPERNAELLEKEYQSLALYRKEAAKLRSPHLVPIEHINRNDSGLYYVMPLADGFGHADPVHPSWLPLSLAAVIEGRTQAEGWFSCDEVVSILQPILQALQTLSDAGLVHRDVKPENILFFNGQPCLGDISLLGVDSAMLTRRGTPGYATPSWYLGGHPDMYGAAATLYTLLTGNAPDKMGRAAFLWPPHGESAMDETARADWNRLHAVIRRASEERVSERYVDFTAMARALSADPATSSAPPQPPASRPRKAGKFLKILAGMFALVFLAVLLPAFIFPPKTPDQHEATTAPLAQEPRSPEPAAPRAGPSTQAFEDSNVAINCLSRIDPYGELFSDAENEIYQNANTRIANAVQDEARPDIPLAIRHLDGLVQAIPKLQKLPNIALIRLLLRQATGETTEAAQAVRDPAFVESVKNEDTYVLGDRVELLCRLKAPDLAELYLRNVIGAGGSTKQQTAAFLSRAKLKASRGEFAGARADADTATRMGAGNPVLEQSTRAELLELVAKVPAYEDYLKSLPGK